MQQYIKNQYASFLVSYLEQELNIKVKNEKTPFLCPSCKKETATLYPNTNSKFYCLTPECKFSEGLDLFDLIRQTKNEKFSDEDVAHFLVHKYKVEVKNGIDDLFKLYEKNEWSLFPLEPTPDKHPQKGFKWTEKEYKNSKIWKDWIDRGYYLALKLGKSTNTLAIDVDDDKTYEKIKHLLPEDTLIQTTLRGKHWIFEYDTDFDFISHRNLRRKNDPENSLDMEVRGNNAYIAIAPTSAKGETRTWNNKPIKKIPEELKKFLLEKIGKNTQTPDQEIQEAINKEKIDGGLKGLYGCCNDWFVTYGGILRKKCNIDQVEWALFNLNNALEDPMPVKDVKSIVRQLNKYQTYDKQELADLVLERLKIIKMATAYQIAMSIKREVKDVEDVLAYLENENKVVDIGNRKYQVAKELEWTTDSSDMSRPVDFEVPYFGDYNYFDWGNMCIIGAVSGTGKTHITGNIIKKLVDQGIKPYLVNTESGSKIGKITTKLGIPNGSFYVPKEPVVNVLDVELPENGISIIDWIYPKDGQYEKMGEAYRHFHEQLKQKGGFCFVLAQLRKSNKEFFARDQVDFFGSCVVKYLFGSNGTDPENTLFQFEKLRDSKTGQQYFTLPMHFSKDTIILEIRK